MMNVLSRTTAVLATAAAATAALVGASTAPASASSGFTVTVQPASNPFLNLDASGGSTSDFTDVIQWHAVAGAPNQIWTFRAVSGGYEIVGRQSGKCITTDGVAGHSVYLQACHERLGQIWSTDIQPNSGVQYTISSNLSGLYLEVNGASGAQGTPIDTWWFNGGFHQYFGATYAV